jgi:hypothetical protein
MAEITVTQGGSQTFTATPNNGKEVDKWLLNGSAAQTGSPTYTLSNIQTNATLQVTFKDTPAANTLQVDPNTLSFPAGGGSETIRITANINWTAGSDQPWATATPGTGSNNATLTVTAQPNTGTQQRTATITITGGGITRTVALTQFAGHPSATTSPEAPEIRSHAGRLHVRTPHAERVEVYALTGQLLHTTQKPPGEAVISLHALPPGILVVRTANITRKVVNSE